jgi:serine/threonine-protein kinase
VLFTIGMAGRATYDDARIAVLSLKTGERRILVDGGTHPRYAPTGHLIYVRAATLLAIPFGLGRLEVTGPSVALLQGVLTEATGAAHWTFSADGSLVYVPGGLRLAARSLLWINRKGQNRLLPIPANTFEEPRLSPNGRRLAVSIRGVTNDVWVYEIRRGTLSRLTFEGDNFSPIWTPDGKRVTFSSNRAGPSNIFWTPADGSGTAERLLESDFDEVPSSWSPDGRMLAFTEYHPDTGADIWVVAIRGDREPRPFLRTPFNEWGAMFSPDGRWLAYTSDESGRPEIYVQAFPRPGRKWQISTEGGTEPIWGRNGRSLFYRQGDKLLTVAVATKPAFRAAKPELLFAGPYLAATAVYLPNYDVTPDDERFLVISQGEEQASAKELHLVLDWFAELADGTRSAW